MSGILGTSVVDCLLGVGWHGGWVTVTGLTSGSRGSWAAVGQRTRPAWVITKPGPTPAIIASGFGSDIGLVFGGGASSGLVLSRSPPMHGGVRLVYIATSG